jgi:hypothetical protein
MPLGKHRGRTLAQIDADGFRDYLEWGATKWDRALGEAVGVYLAGSAKPPDARARLVAELAAAPPFEAPGDDDDVPY